MTQTNVNNKLWQQYLKVNDPLYPAQVIIAETATSLQSSDTQWTVVSDTFVAPSTIVTVILEGPVALLEGGKTVYFDDIQLYKND